MDKFILFCFMCLIILMPCYANSQQCIDNEQTYFTSNVDKMPQTEEGKQSIKNKFTFFTSNVIVNGKTEIVIPNDEQFEVIKNIIKDRN